MSRSLSVLSAVGLLVLAQAARPQEVGFISVSISDNIIVIDAEARSGQIDLVNGSDDPMEFTVTPMGEVAGIEASARPILRWAPEKAVAPAHRSLPFRVLARKSNDLEPGEYAFQFGVKAAVQRKELPITITRDEKDAPPTIGAVVPVVPVLPVTVYVRHKIETPKVDPQPIVLTPEDPQNLGHFMVVKREPKRGFVGQIRVIDKETGQVLSSGRLHLAQSGSQAKVDMPRETFPADRIGSYCLQVWDHFPARGEPYATICS